MEPNRHSSPTAYSVTKKVVKTTKIKIVWTTEATSRFKFNGEERIKEIAEIKKDEMFLVQLLGLNVAHISLITQGKLMI